MQNNALGQFKQETEFLMQLWVSNFFGVFRGRLKLENAF